MRIRDVSVSLSADSPAAPDVARHGLVHRDNDRKGEPLLYKWWVFDGASWTIARDWSTWARVRMESERRPTRTTRSAYR
jgi:hypothetical protein